MPEFVPRKKLFLKRGGLDRRDGERENRHCDASGDTQASFGNTGEDDAGNSPRVEPWIVYHPPTRSLRCRQVHRLVGRGKWIRLPKQWPGPFPT